MERMSPERNNGHDSQPDDLSWLRHCRIYGDRSDISAWALFVVRSTVQGKCESLEGWTAMGRFTLFSCHLTVWTATGENKHILIETF